MVVIILKTCLDVICVAFITLGVMYLVDNRKQINNAVIKPITNLMKGNN